MVVECEERNRKSQVTAGIDLGDGKSQSTHNEQQSSRSMLDD